MNQSYARVWKKELCKNLKWVLFSQLSVSLRFWLVSTHFGVRSLSEEVKDRKLVLLKNSMRLLLSLSLSLSLSLADVLHEMCKKGYWKMMSQKKLLSVWHPLLSYAVYVYMSVVFTNEVE